MEENFSPLESLQVIEKTINRVKHSYHDTGIGPILWGCVVMVCSLVSFFAGLYKQYGWFNIWFLTIVAIVPQIIISMREKKERRHTSFNDFVGGAVWTTFGFSMFVLSTLDNMPGIEIHGSVYMLIYGFPTLITGWICKVRLMVVGGILCWVFAIASTLVPHPYPFLFMAGCAIAAWLIPGLQLNYHYRKQRRHV